MSGTQREVGRSGGAVRGVGGDGIRGHQEFQVQVLERAITGQGGSGLGSRAVSWLSAEVEVRGQWAGLGKQRAGP